MRCYGLTGILLLAALGARAENPVKKAEPRGSGALPVVDWLKAPTTPLSAKEIDALIAAEHKQAGVQPSPRTTDEQFLRRVTLDVTGRLPQPDEIAKFVNDPDPGKRAKIIDKLLESDEYASYWTSYWRDVVSIRLTDFNGRRLVRHFEQWMRVQLKENKKWDEIAREMLTATGQLRYDDTTKNGAGYFLAAHMGADATAEQTAETARVFLGIQINCAQCHDHPFDVWKREQFHELAAFFARSRPRLVREEERFVGVQIGGAGGFGGGRGFGGGEYRMPAKDNPRGGTVMHPKYLDGKAPGRGLSDEDRRKNLADSITSKNNPWFSASFVNRIWSELLGQGFYATPDDLGPQKEAYLGSVLARLAGGFRGSDYNVKELFRVILNTETYQRQSRTAAAPGDHLLFGASHPKRLRGEALIASLQHTLGRMSGGFGGGRPGGPGGRPGGFGGPEAQIRAEFAFDPSMKAEDIEGSIPQALILMNSSAVQARIPARGDNLLAKVLADHKTDAAALEAVYLRALARKPTEREQAKCLDLVKKVGSRDAAFEDILWALINSTEFQTRR